MNTKISNDAIYILCLIHLLFSGITFFDLLLVSKRRLKLMWTMVILLIPFLGPFLYRLTMTRSRRHVQF